MKPITLDEYKEAGEEFFPKYFYVAQACMALDISLEEVMDRNIDKLSKRYPAGTFDAYYSENRQAGDL